MKSTIRAFRYYDLILAFFASILLISNLGATKLIAFGPIITDGGAILFPLVYIFGDILTEVYGYRYARRAIWTGFGVMLLAVFAFTIVQQAPGAPEWQNQEAYNTVLGFFPRIVLASLCAYLVGEFVNSWVLAKLKVRTQGKMLWARLIGSTVAGELLDTTVFALVAFGGILTGTDMLKFIAIGWAFKTGVEIILLPITYRVIAFLKKREQSDAYDTKTSFTPFKLRLTD
jgi:queuosine precursor transporter